MLPCVNPRPYAIYLQVFFCALWHPAVAPNQKNTKTTEASTSAGVKRGLAITFTKVPVSPDTKAKTAAEAKTVDDLLTSDGEDNTPAPPPAPTPPAATTTIAPPAEENKRRRLEPNTDSKAEIARLQETIAKLQQRGDAYKSKVGELYSINLDIKKDLEAKTQELDTTRKRLRSVEVRYTKTRTALERVIVSELSD